MVMSARAARRRQRRRRRSLFVGLGAALLLVAGTTAWSLTRDDSSTPAAPAQPSTTTTTTAPLPPPPPTAVVATTTGADLEVRDAPDEAAVVTTSLSAVTEYGLPRTVLVVDRQPGWLHALLPMRPNGAAGWIREQDTTLTETTKVMTISLSARTLTLRDGDTELLAVPVGIGTEATPTPLGLFYITDPVDLTDQPNGAYGAFALGISGYSEVLLTFNGGPGQIAVHGTTNPADLGQAVSNGCIRVLNDKIVELALLAPLGTPVEIVA